ncbi:hypothetical protein B4U80_13324 [Leptotrombidium deliense]|uniref:Ig-like domain-containing protein n=1 Tax=Leptotrombidium deliense TaxID=299467 RepID=A0A443S867_9ACAR|nr:hypothetical protein B4U80_13324 [Leptotrombidium deliense]
MLDKVSSSPNVNYVSSTQKNQIHSSESLDETIDELQEDDVSTQTPKESLNSQAAVGETLVDSNANLNHNFTNIINEVKESISKLSLRVDTLYGTIHLFNCTIDELETKGSNNAQIEELRKEIENLSQRLNEAEYKISNHSDELQSVVNTKIPAFNKFAYVDKKFVEWKERSDNFESRLIDLEGKYIQLKNNFSETQETIDQLNSKLTDFDNKCSKQQTIFEDDLEQVSQRLNHTTNMLSEKYENINFEVKNLLNLPETISLINETCSSKVIEVEKKVNLFDSQLNTFTQNISDAFDAIGEANITMRRMLNDINETYSYKCVSLADYLEHLENVDEITKMLSNQLNVTNETVLNTLNQSTFLKRKLESVRASVTLITSRTEKLNNIDEILFMNVTNFERQIDELQKTVELILPKMNEIKDTTENIERINTQCSKLQNYHETNVTMVNRILTDIDRTFISLTAKLNENENKIKKLVNNDGRISMFGAAYFDVKYEQITIKQGESITIFCEPKGNPEPQVSWRVNDEHLLTSSKRIDIRKASQNMTYVCIARNFHNEQMYEAKKTFKIEVLNQTPELIQICEKNKTIRANIEWQVLVSHQKYGLQPMKQSSCIVEIDKQTFKFKKQLQFEVMEVYLNKKHKRCEGNTVPKNVNFVYISDRIGEEKFICGLGTHMFNSRSINIITTLKNYLAPTINKTKIGFKLKFKLQ